MDQEGDLQPGYRIARKLGVSRQLVNSWRASGKLKPAGLGADGRPLYSLAAAILVERDTRRSGYSHRHTA